ncbi:nuclear transport factor 2 family protein [Sphingobium sp. EP60837]|uniref:nuclear transport factor 2 family protein n=1 Tax=Sphingobium sp. EP60837 TaxID=1855519 RepID=UPI0007DDFA5D|nr:nuclear transport factor 2 family protein [Sphingobium sp. EP60837]ANI80179.1 hypothetical protein EP837_03799 [Sphingobium sp. EP60837]
MIHDEYSHIAQLGYLYGRGADNRGEFGHKFFDKSLLDDVEVVYDFGRWRGLAEHKKRIANLQAAFTFTHHAVTSPLIDIVGDEAMSEYKVVAGHGVLVDGRTHVVWGGAIYRQHCLRTEAGWRVRQHICENSWVDDPAGLMARAMEALSQN